MATEAEAVFCMGPGAQLVKVDIYSVHSMLPIHLNDWRLLGIQCEGKLFVETALTIGLKSAPN